MLVATNRWALFVEGKWDRVWGLYKSLSCSLYLLFCWMLGPFLTMENVHEASWGPWLPSMLLCPILTCFSSFFWFILWFLVYATTTTDFRQPPPKETLDPVASTPHSSLPPGLWRPLIYFLFLWICLFRAGEGPGAGGCFRKCWGAVGLTTASVQRHRSEAQMRQNPRGRTAL